MRYRYFVDFGRGISLFSNFSYGIVALGTPQFPPRYTDVSFLCSRAQVFQDIFLTYFQDPLNTDYFVCGFSVSDLNCNARPLSNFHLFSCFVEVILNCYNTKTNLPFSSVGIRGFQYLRCVAF